MFKEGREGERKGPKILFLGQERPSKNNVHGETPSLRSPFPGAVEPSCGSGVRDPGVRRGVESRDEPDPGKDEDSFPHRRFTHLDAWVQKGLRSHSVPSGVDTYGHPESALIPGSRLLAKGDCARQTRRAVSPKRTSESRAGRRTLCTHRTFGPQQSHLAGTTLGYPNS